MNKGMLDGRCSLLRAAAAARTGRSPAACSESGRACNQRA